MVHPCKAQFQFSNIIIQAASTELRNVKHVELACVATDRICMIRGSPDSVHAYSFRDLSDVQAHQSDQVCDNIKKAILALVVMS